MKEGKEHDNWGVEISMQRKCPCTALMEGRPHVFDTENEGKGS